MNKTPPASDALTAFARFAGEMAESLSFNRSLGQIYGLLYASSAPMSLEDISRALSMSKGNASINVRVLEEWGAVRLVPVNGSRRDYYEAEIDVRGLALRRLQEGLTRRLDRAEKRFEELLKGVAEGDPAREKLRKLRGLLSDGRRALGLLQKVGKFL